MRKNQTLLALDATQSTFSYIKNAQHGAILGVFL
jgi:hypothetical protein